MPTKQDIQQLVAGFSIETTPHAAESVEHFADWLPHGTRVYVTFLPGTHIEQTLATCKKLKQQSMTPVPHLAMRHIESEAHLQHIFSEIARLNIHDLLLIAGATGYPKGPYHCVEQILNSNILEQYDIHSIGFAGHPEGNPDIAEQALRHAENVKQQYATTHPRQYQFVSQFCFKAKPIIQWSERLHHQQIEIPIHAGIPGLASAQTLVKHAKSCGVGASMTFLKKYSGKLFNIMTVSTPDTLLYDLAEYNCQHPQNSLIEKLHFYPLGGFQKTAAWIHAVQEGRFSLTQHGFDVFVERCQVANLMSSD